MLTSKKWKTILHDIALNKNKNYLYMGIKLCNQTSDPNEYVIFFKDRVGKPIYMHLLLKIKVFPKNIGLG